MTLSPGSRLGPYEILSPLGAGGMGEVYRARDMRVDRMVALKVLPEEFFESEERRGRFEREARMLASLNHPGDRRSLLIRRNPLFLFLFSLRPATSSSWSSSRAKTSRCASPPALFHSKNLFPSPGRSPRRWRRRTRRGSIHRDLKPANVKVTPDGRVKLLDFGLAKIFEGDSGAGSSPSVTHSPTLTARGTAAGVILGTAAYMSPEQARGKPVDKRTDVWAFGAVLYEMLTGKRAFEGETVSDILAAVLKEEPDWAALPEQTPGKIRDLLRKCLRREVKQRLHDIADARLELEELGATAGSGPSPFEENLTACPAPL